MKFYEKLTTNFSRACFKNIDQDGCEMIITELLGYIGAGDFNDVQTASGILSTIAVNHPNKIRPMAPMLKVDYKNFSFKNSRRNFVHL